MNARLVKPEMQSNQLIKSMVAPGCAICTQLVNQLEAGRDNEAQIPHQHSATSAAQARKCRRRLQSKAHVAPTATPPKHNNPQSSHARQHPHWQLTYVNLPITASLRRRTEARDVTGDSRSTGMQSKPFLYSSSVALSISEPRNGPFWNCG